MVFFVKDLQLEKRNNAGAYINQHLFYVNTSMMVEGLVAEQVFCFLVVLNLEPFYPFPIS